ncbi:cupin domain-containing protein [Epidermidibacterium keratini]|uniref:Cupin domain-containing protein n=1 Tax=Epidermidibacterium keratini TaxID=1891644 RepID=A0A7L4YNK2_9ACTN|nr:cupin domain-containing protein [Epidermidibacterium keratini]QHC00389.1 cupin domain-containing protein [Epidermidibacterium keratini]
MHSTPDDLVTDSFESGSIKWGVSPDLEDAASLTTGEVVINPTKGHDRHNHPDSDEVLYIIEGEGVQTVGDDPEFTVSAGDTVYIPKGVEHSTFNTGWRQLRILAVYNPGGAEKALRELPDYRAVPPGEVITVERS